MKKYDYLWIGIILVIIFLIISPYTNSIFINITMNYPYILAFIKFMILATMGEILAIRIKKNFWEKPIGVFYRAVIWGFFGILITIAFNIFSNGIIACQFKGYILGDQSHLAFAFFTATFMNLFFAPVFMAMHKCTDSYIDMKFSNKKRKITFNLNYS